MPIFSSGDYTVAVTVDDWTSKGVFTVVEGPPVVQILPTPPPSTSLVDALTSLTQEENLIRVWTFDNAAKTWEFFDPRPAVVNANTITTMVPSRIYWIQLVRNQSATLNGRVVSMFEGWNLVPW